MYFMLKSYCSNMHSCRVRIRTDNSTVVGYITNTGGTKSIQCHDMAMGIWKFAIERSLWLSAEHLPGSDCVLADSASLVFHTDTE